MYTATHVYISSVFIAYDDNNSKALCIRFFKSILWSHGVFFNTFLKLYNTYVFSSVPAHIIYTRDSVVRRLIRIIINTDPVLRSSDRPRTFYSNRRRSVTKNINIKRVNRFKPHRDSTSRCRVHGKSLKVSSKVPRGRKCCVIVAASYFVSSAAA